MSHSTSYYISSYINHCHKTTILVDVYKLLLLRLYLLSRYIYIYLTSYTSPSWKIVVHSTETLLLSPSCVTIIKEGLRVDCFSHLVGSISKHTHLMAGVFLSKPRIFVRWIFLTNSDCLYFHLNRFLIRPSRVESSVSLLLSFSYPPIVHRGLNLAINMYMISE